MIAVIFSSAFFSSPTTLALISFFASTTLFDAAAATSEAFCFASATASATFDEMVCAASAAEWVACFACFTGAGVEGAGAEGGGAVKGEERVKGEACRSEKRQYPETCWKLRLGGSRSNRRAANAALRENAPEHRQRCGNREPQRG